MQYFSCRWRGQVALSKLLIWDMLAIGTMLNLASGFLALMLLAKGTAAAAVIVHFALIPYNFFLLLAVLRLPKKSNTSMAVAGTWLVLMTIA